MAQTPDKKLRDIAEALKLPMFTFSKGPARSHKELEVPGKYFNVKTLEDLGKAAEKFVSETKSPPKAS